MSGWDVAGGGDYEILSTDDRDPGSPRSHLGRRLAIGGVAASVVAVAVAGYVAYGALSGGGAQPETVVPASAAAYGEIDLDPAAGQKVAAARFLHRFPQLAKKLDAEGDVGRSLVAAAFDDSGDVNFDKEIKPWLGNRVGLALVPGVDGHKMTYEIAVQVKDEAAAREALPGLVAKAKKANAENRDGLFYVSESGSSSDGDSTSSGSCPSPDPKATEVSCAGSSDLPSGFPSDLGPSDIPEESSDPLLRTALPDTSAIDYLARSPEGWVIQGGYLILAPSQKDADALAKSSTTRALADDAKYRDDVRPLGDHVASVWEDAAALKGLDVDRSGFPLGAFSLGVQSDGRTALALKFTSSAAEVVGWSTATSAQGKGHATQLQTLPADTMLGFEMTDGSQVAKDVWASYSQLLDAFPVREGTSFSDTLKQEYGLNMPDDLVSLIGTDLLVGIKSSEVGGASVRATVPAAKVGHLMSVANRVLRDTDQKVTRTSDGLAWTNNKAYDAQVGKGTLGTTDEFRAAMPEIDDASWAFYLNFAKFPTDTETDDEYAHLGTLGITTHSDGNKVQIFARLSGR